MTETTNTALRPRISISPHLAQVCLPPSQEEIARAFENENVSLVELLLQLDSMPWFCPCALAEDRTGCMRRMQMARMRCRPRARARRRQRHGGSRRERSPPSDGDGDGGADPPPAPPPPHEVARGAS